MRARPLEKMMRRGPTNQAPPQTVRETNRSESVQGLDLAVDLAPNNPHHLWLSNPVMIASGTFGYDGYGRGITEDMDLGELGAVVPKTFTRLPREGNPEPQWFPKSYREAWDTGDHLFLDEEVWCVTRIDRRKANLKRLIPSLVQKTVEIDFLRNVPLLDNLSEVQPVSHRGREYLLLDPFTLQTVEAISPEDWKGDKISALRYGNDTYFIWD